MKQKLGNIFLILLGIGLVLYLSISGVSDLANKKDMKTLNIKYAAPFLDIQHSINGLIPIGTDHYYVAYDEVTDGFYIIKGAKSWMKKNFNSDYEALNPDGLTITSLAKRVSDFDVRREIEYRASELEGANYPIGVEMCIMLDYKVKAILKIVDVLLLIFVVGSVKVFGIGRKSEEGVQSESTVFAKLWIVALLVSVALMLYCIM